MNQWRRLAAGVALSIGMAGAAHAQASAGWLAAAGPSVPSGDFNAYSNVGWTAIAGWESSSLHHPVTVRVDASYGVNSDSTDVGFHEHTALMTAMGSVVYHFNGAWPHLYALVGGGYFRRRFTTDEPDVLPETITQFGMQFGEGLLFGNGAVKVFAEGRFVTSFGPDRLQYIPVVVGVRIGGRTQ